jgi:hypothetical protein
MRLSSFLEGFEGCLAEAELFGFEESKRHSRNPEFGVAFIRKQSDLPVLPFQAPDQLFQVHGPPDHASYLVWVCCC